MSLQPPPTTTPIISDPSGFLNLQWIVFLEQLFTGDAGTSWEPTIEGLTLSGAGTPEITGRYYRLSQYLTLFIVRIMPQPSQSISGTAGSYAVNNFPLQMQGDGVCFAVSGNLGTVSGMCTASSNLIFPPGLSAVTVPITILGIVEAQ